MSTYARDRPGKPTAIVPIRPIRLGLARLHSEIYVAQQIAAAMAHDCLEAYGKAAGIGQLVAVTADEGLARIARRHGAVVVADRPLMQADGVNDAVRIGLMWARLHRPRLPVVVVPADMPTFKPGELNRTIIALGRRENSFVPDRRGVGTTLLYSTDVETLRPAYGARSAILHSAGGSRPVEDVPPAARHDIDTFNDLANTRLEDLGRRTRAALVHYGVVRELALA